MKKLDIIFKTLMSLTIVIFITSCEIDSFAESDEHSFGDIVAPSNVQVTADIKGQDACLLYTSPSPRDKTVSRMPSSA